MYRKQKTVSFQGAKDHIKKHALMSNDLKMKNNNAVPMTFREETETPTRLSPSMIITDHTPHT